MRPKSIRVKAVPGVLAPRPRHGGRDPYFGRGTDNAAHLAHELEHDALHPVLADGEVVPSMPLDIFAHVCRYVREGALLPADDATARYLGMTLPKPSKPKNTDTA